MVFRLVKMLFKLAKAITSRHYHSMKLTSVGINNGLPDEVEHHPIVIRELLRLITTDIKAILTAAPQQQRPEIRDLILASENPAIDK
jgi:hypothetical protein